MLERSRNEAHRATDQLRTQSNMQLGEIRNNHVRAMASEFCCLANMIDANDQSETAGPSCLDAADRVFDDNGVLWIDAKLGCCL